MKCFKGIEKKLEDNTLFYRELVQIDKDWSNTCMFRFFCSRNKSGCRVLYSLNFLYFGRGQAVKQTIAVIQFRGNKGMNDPFGVFLRYKFPDFTEFV